MDTEEAKPTFNVPIIWVLGGPGSGKGTQCDMIVARYGFTHLSSGDLLRAEVASGSPRGQELSDTMAKGALVPMEVVLDLLREAMLKAESPKGFLIDGYPREKIQGVQFENTIGYVDIVLFFDCSEATLTARLLGRAANSGRVDDNEETIKKRLVTFNTYNNEIVEHYAMKLKRINAERSPDDIFAEVVQYLDDVMAKSAAVAQ